MMKNHINILFAAFFAVILTACDTNTESMAELAERGNAEAQYMLAKLYETGKRVEQSDVQAAKWFERAAVQGHAQAQNAIGIFYETGKGITQNYEKAVSWYQKAALQGNELAQSNLSIMYGTGRGIEKSFTHTYMWASLAKQNGNNRGSDIIGLISKEMSEQMILEAKRMSEICFNSDYKECG